jgi:hypothetical protein
VQIQSNHQHPISLETMQPAALREEQGEVRLPQGSTPKRRRERKAWRGLQWLFLWVSVAGIIGSSGMLAVLWLFYTPASQCYALSALAAPGRRLFCAQQFADSGDTKELLVALETVAQMTDDPTFAPEVQRLLREWSTQGIAIAQAEVNQGNLEKGIEIAERIPIESPFYPDAQSAIAIWEAEWKAGAEIVRQFDTALSAQEWEIATQLFLSLGEFKSDYWRITRADELMFKLSQGKTASQKRQDLASFMTTKVSPQQERLIAVLVEINQSNLARKVSTSGWESVILNLMGELWDKQQLSQLQQVARVIQPDSEVYVEAQDWLLLVQATELANRGTLGSLTDAIATLSESIALLQPLTQQSQIYPLAQQQKIQWEETRQSLQAQADTAKLTPFIQPSQPRPMMGVVESIQPRLNPESQQALRRITPEQKLEKSRAILQAASQLANQQQFSAAIKKAAEIQPDQPLYQQAKIAIATWKAQQ